MKINEECAKMIDTLQSHIKTMMYHSGKYHFITEAMTEQVGYHQYAVGFNQDGTPKLMRVIGCRLGITMVDPLVVVCRNYDTGIIEEFDSNDVFDYDNLHIWKYLADCLQAYYKA